MAGAIKAAEHLRDTIPGSVILGQFDNPANPQRHYQTTGKEIWEDTDGQVDIFVAGVGTGGTVSGVGRRLKEMNPNVTIIAAEPALFRGHSGCKNSPAVRYVHCNNGYAYSSAPQKAGQRLLRPKPTEPVFLSSSYP